MPAIVPTNLCRAEAATPAGTADSRCRPAMRVSPSLPTLAGTAENFCRALTVQAMGIPSRVPNDRATEARASANRENITEAD